MLLSILFKDEGKLLQISLNLPLEILDVLVRDHILQLFLLLLLRGHNGRPIEQLLGAILLSPSSSSSYSSPFSHIIESQRSVGLVVEFEVQSRG